MNFNQAFKSIKTGISNVDTKSFDRNFAIQFTMTNKDCGGIFYIEYKDGKVNVEPYNYYDNNVDISAGYNDLCKVLNGTLNISNASEKGKLIMQGDSNVFTSFVSALNFKIPNKKKKTSAKKTAQKSKSKSASKTASNVLASKSSSTKNNSSKTSSLKTASSKSNTAKASASNSGAKISSAKTSVAKSSAAK